MTPNNGTPVNHEENANAIMLKVREMAQAIPGFVFAAKGRRRKITTSASVPDAFLETVAVACDASPGLGTPHKVTSAELRDCMTFSRVYTSVAQELIVIARGFLDTVAECRHHVGVRARQVYKHAKNVNEPEEREALVPHLQEMQRALGRGRKRVKTAVKPVPPPPPAPPSPTAPAPVAPTVPPKTT